MEHCQKHVFIPSTCTVPKRCMINGHTNNPKFSPSPNINILSRNPDMSSIYSKMDFPSTKVIVSTAASLAATAMLLRSFARDFIPRQLMQYASIKFYRFLATFSKEATIQIDEYDGLNKNKLFYAAEMYVGTIVSPSVRAFRASLPEKEKKIHLSLGEHQEIADKFGGIQLKWRLVPATKLHKKHYNKVVDDYLPYVLKRSEAVKEEKKVLKLFLQNDRVHGPRIHPWQSVNLDHPAKFDTLAMDDEIKQTIIDDLDMFVKRKEFYRKVGKAWKRGYLLFGPPGTGKSSLIAAMANYLNFDVYDLELAYVMSNSELRKLLISTANRSILVVEDIDASIDLSDRKNKAAETPPPFRSMYPLQQQQQSKVTLSGLLNFIDGLWSSVGDERIIIFTTNHKDRLDPALLRPGRMDVHIHMSYCTPCGFRLLACNYLGIRVSDNPLMSKAEELIRSKKVTPAEIAEQLLKSEDPEVALHGLIKFLEEYGKRIKEEEREKDGMTKLKDEMKELVKIGNAKSNGKVVNKDEAANAFKVLFGFLEQEFGTGKTNDVHPKENGIVKK